MTVKKQNVTVTVHARTVNSWLHRCHRNFCILIGLLACDNSCVRGQIMPPPLPQKRLRFNWPISFEIVNGITHFCTELPSNCTALDQSDDQIKG